MKRASRALAGGLVLGLACAALAQTQDPQTLEAASVLASSKEGAARLKTLLAAIDYWQPALPAECATQTSLAVCAGFKSIKERAAALKLKPDQPVNPVEDDFKQWQQVLLSDLYTGNEARFFNDPQRFADYIQQRLDALAAIREGERRSPAQTKKFDALRDQVNGIPDAETLHRIYDKLNKGAPLKISPAVRAVTFSGPLQDSDAGVATTKPVFQSPDALSPPASPAAASSTPSWKDYFDLDRAKRLAQTVYRRAIGFTHRCYEYVADAMESSGLFSPASGDAQARKRFAYYWPPVGGSSAYQFAALKDHPDVMRKTGIATLDPKTRPLPIGTVIVYGRGCMGFSAKHGHIEVIAKASSQPHPVSFYACSDGCTWRTDAWMDSAVSRQCVDMFIPVRSPGIALASNNNP